MNSRFFWKLYAGYIAVITLTAIASAAVMSRQVTQLAEHEIQSDLERQTALLLPFCRQHLDRGLPSASVIAGAFERSEARLTLIDAQGRVLVDSWEDPETMDNHADRPEILEAKALGMGFTRRFSDTIGEDLSYVARRIGGPGNAVGYIRAAKTLASLEDRAGLLRWRVAQATLIAAILGLIPSLFLARRVVAPLSELGAAARRLANGDYETPARRVESIKELAQLAADVESMRKMLRQRVEAITQDRNKLAAVLSGMVEGMVSVDIEERIVHINGAAGVIFQTEPQAALGRRIWELPHAREVAEVVEECMETGNAIMREVRLVDLRIELVVEVVASPLRDGAGDIMGATIVLHDITRIRQLEKIRRDFVANASHELSTPITGIIGSVDTLLDDAHMPEDIRIKFLERIRGSAERLVELTRDLNSLSRLEEHDRGDPGFADFAEVVRESVTGIEPAALNKALSLKLIEAPEKLTVKAWQEDLRLVVDNLVTNAVKYTEKGEIQVRLMLRGAAAVLEVKDTGIGIEPVHAERIFERFYRVDEARTREAGGSGLGLAIVRNVARTLGGNVAVQSEPGKGSTFIFSVPRVSEDAM